MEAVRSPSRHEESSRLILLDANHLMHRAYWAIQRSLQTKSGEQTNAVFGVASMLLTLLEREHPDSIIACFDEGKETVRHKAYEGYKAGRAETPDDFYAQIPRVKECFQAFGIPTLSHPKYEADDLIGTLALMGRSEGCDIVIVTGDRDLFQLVDGPASSRSSASAGRIRIAVPHKGYAEPQYLDVEGVKEKLGVKPEQVPDYKGLTGDPSDNLKGVAGIGPKTAATLLQKYGSLERIYENLMDIRVGTAEKLKADRESAFATRDLARIITDVPDVSLEEGPWRADSGAIEAFFSALELSTLQRRLKDLRKRDAFLQSHLHGSVVSDGSSEPESSGWMGEESLPRLD